jgi:hypothetical protein
MIVSRDCESRRHAGKLTQIGLLGAGGAERSFAGARELLSAWFVCKREPMG